MIRKTILSFLLAMIAVSVTAANDPERLTLRYDRPADYWVEALPLGNGRLGAMVYGGIPQDTIQLNEDTFWSGSPYNNLNLNSLSHLQQIRVDRQPAARFPRIAQICHRLYPRARPDQSIGTYQI